MLNRRDFLKGGCAGALGLFLGGCGFGKQEQAEPAQEMGEVIYRTIPHGGQKVSVVSLGTGSLHESSAGEVERIVDHALGSGINLVDTVMPNLDVAEAIGKAMKPYRQDVINQVHLGAFYPGGVCERTRDMKDVRAGFEQQVKLYGSGSDVGMIHYVDDEEDYQKVMQGGLWEYAQELKQKGDVRYLGFSSHSVEISRKFLATGLIDVFMFSLNPAYDFESTAQGLKISMDRTELYAEAKRQGAAITVMKAYSGGKLLSDEASPFGKAMTTSQCVQYCMDRPAVVSAVAGVKNMSELNAATEYFTASQEEKDYSFLLSATAAQMEGVCIYCNHCQPCPVDINIGDVNKYYDLAKNGDGLAREHYLALDRRAGDCTDCGACEPRCPFHVKVRERMHEIAAYFGS